MNITNEQNKKELIIHVPTKEIKTFYVSWITY